MAMAPNLKLDPHTMDSVATVVSVPTVNLIPVTKAATTSIEDPTVMAPSMDSLTSTETPTVDTVDTVDTVRQADTATRTDMVNNRVNMVTTRTPVDMAPRNLKDMLSKASMEAVSRVRATVPTGRRSLEAVETIFKDSTSSQFRKFKTVVTIMVLMEAARATTTPTMHLTPSMVEARLITLSRVKLIRMRRD